MIADAVATTVNDLDECTSADAIHCTYDLNGNLITKQIPLATWQFTYDALNQLTQASTDSQKVEMTYDPSGRRLSKVTYTAAASVWLESSRQHYLYDGDGNYKQYRGSGKPHGKTPRPNVKETKNNPSPTGQRPGKPQVREANPDEVPKGK